MGVPAKQTVGETILFIEEILIEKSAASKEMGWELWISPQEKCSQTHFAWMKSSFFYNYCVSVFTICAIVLRFVWFMLFCSCIWVYLTPRLRFIYICSKIKSETDDTCCICTNTSGSMQAVEFYFETRLHKGIDVKIFVFA